MLERMTIENFRCFRNFSIDFTNLNSCVVLGRNGAGKSTIGTVIEIIQKMARQTSRVADLLKISDLSDQSSGPVLFQIEARISGIAFVYRLVFELPERFKELRVKEERLSVDGVEIFARSLAQISLKRSAKVGETSFGVDWHIVALPIIQTLSQDDPVEVFRKWLSRIVVLRPVPSQISGESQAESALPLPSAENFGDWFSGTLVANPSSYEPFIGFLKEVMPDLSSVKNPSVGSDSRAVVAEFKAEARSISIQLARLSDGEKCFFVCALLIAMAAESKPFMCFWDEPDNYLAPQEVSSTMLALRRAFRSESQLIVTSHNPDAIRCFSDESTLVLNRASHLASPTVKPLANGGALNRWLRGDMQL